MDRGTLAQATRDTGGLNWDSMMEVYGQDSEEFKKILGELSQEDRDALSRLMLAVISPRMWRWTAL